MTRHRPRRLSRADSDRLLDVGTGADPLSALLAAAAAPPDEPVPGEAEAMMHFRAARAVRARKEAVLARTTRGAYATRPTSAPQAGRKGLKVAAAALALTVTSGVAVAATGALPEPLQRVAHSAFGAPAVKGSNEGAGTSGNGANDASGSGHANGSRSDHPTPNGSPSPSLRGLCVAYRAGAPSNPRVLDNPAFSALVVAAGGVERVADFCNTLVPAQPKATPAHPTPTRPSHPAHPTEPKKKG